MFSSEPNAYFIFLLFLFITMYKQLNESNTTFKENLQSWNKLSHVLYIDSPSETGFSPKNDGVFNNHKVISIIEYQVL